jgi:transcriptional regulator with XRE-family HTH domain
MDKRDLGDIAWIRSLAEMGALPGMRRFAGLSLSEVARTLGVAPSTVMRWERADSMPRPAAALAYADLLRTLDWLRLLEAE